MKILIRNAKTNELNRVSYITKLSWKKPYKEGGFINNFHEHKDLLEKFKNKSINILVAVLDEKIIGSVRYEFSNKEEIYFSKLVILPSFRRRGIGSALIKKLEQIAKKKKVKKILLDVMEEKLLVPYYKNLGYLVNKRIKHMDHHDVYMFKNRIKGCFKNSLTR